MNKPNGSLDWQHIRTVAVDAETRPAQHRDGQPLDFDERPSDACGAADDGHAEEAEPMSPAMRRKEKKQEEKAHKVLVDLAKDVELFHNSNKEAWASFELNGHRENWPLRSHHFRLQLQHRYYQLKGRAPPKQALEDAISTLTCMALFDNPQESLHLRIADGVSDNTYIDLINEDWQAIEVSAIGWRVVAQSPVRFRRLFGNRALPRPIPGGHLNELRPFINISSDDNWILAICWLLAALCPSGPYPILIWSGEQGSCKSTATKVLRALIDPNVANLRTAPRDERDLVITASNSWVIVLDNVSKLADWLSDALCRLATGGGLATRQLYTDTDEIIFDVQRPVILNGIADLATRGDLMDRSITIQLAEVAENKRRNEKEFWAAFEEAKPRIPGAVLDALSKVLVQLPMVQIERSPRMMDFAILGVAAEQVLGWPAGSFLRAYSENRSIANAAVLESSVVGMAVRAYVLDQNNDFEGTPKDLLDVLTRTADAKLTSDRYWPKNPTSFGKQFRRVAPSLRQVGIQVCEDRTSCKRVIRVAKQVSHPSHPSSSLETNNLGVTRDDRCDTSAKNVSQAKCTDTKADDTCDTCDALFPATERRVEYYPE